MKAIEVKVFECKWRSGGRLRVYPAGVHRRIHDVHPAFEGRL